MFGLIWFSSFRGEDLNVIFYQNMSNLLNDQGLVLRNECHFQQYFSYIMVFSFISGGNQSTRRKHDQIMPSNYKADLPAAADFSVTSDLFLFLLTLLLLSLTEVGVGFICIAVDNGRSSSSKDFSFSLLFFLFFLDPADVTVVSAILFLFRPALVYFGSFLVGRAIPINDVTVAEGGFTVIWSSITSSSSSFQSVSGSGVELLLKYNVDLCQINTIGTL
jgi:hypothetical protein